MSSEKKNKPKEESKKEPKPEKIKKPLPTWDEVESNVYEKIEYYATRFIIIALIGVIIGVIGNITDEK